MAGINGLDIKQLRVLQLLLQQRNLYKVANIMGLTQQAISELLRKLRDTFGDDLFIRTSNGVIPTQLAQDMTDNVNQILMDIDVLITPTILDPASLKGTFQISTSDYALVTVLHKLFSQVSALAPPLKIVAWHPRSDSSQTHQWLLSLLQNIDY